MGVQRNIKALQVVNRDLIKSGLVNGKDLDYLRDNYGITKVIDLTERQRYNIKNWCKRNDITYCKIPINSESPNKEKFKTALSEITPKSLVMCFHGKHKSRALIGLWQIKNGENASKILDILNIEWSGKKKKLLNLIAEISFYNDL